MILSGGIFGRVHVTMWRGFAAVETYWLSDLMRGENRKVFKAGAPMCTRRYERQ